MVTAAMCLWDQMKSKFRKDDTDDGKDNGGNL